MGREKQHLLQVVMSLVLLVGVFLAAIPASVARAQEGQSQGHLVISSSDSDSVPAIILRAFGLDNDGNALQFAADNISVTHNGVPVSDVAVVDDYKAGTFTIIVVDVPPGVEAQMATLQETIEQFTSPPNMEEPVDYVALYQIGETEAAQLLPPTNFYNTIRNFFANPLTTQSGPTALLDSLGALLNDASTIAPKDGLLTSIVLITDGTDVVSSQYDGDAIGRLADELGIPIHSIWLENENLQSFSHEAGRNFLNELAARSGGVAARLDDPNGIQTIWDRIGSFRNHAVIQYRPENIAGGTYEVTLSWNSDPAIQDTTSVTIASDAPSVQLDLPPEERQLVLENLDDPITLTLSAVVTWLDGQERELSNAQLLVNGVVVEDIKVNDIDRFRAEIGNLSYGPNTIQVAVEDESGQKATSPEITLTVSEGETALPEGATSGGPSGSRVVSLILSCLIIILLLVLLGLIVYTIYRRRSPGGRSVRRGKGQQDQPPSRVTKPKDMVQGPFSGAPYLEVVSSVTRMPMMIELTGAEHRIGRSPNQSDISFENDITVSRMHATIVLEGNDYRIYDEKSTGGTFVNGQPVPGYGSQLLDGDEIQLGDVVLRYHRG